ncbi:MAG: Thioredoxin [Thermoleophilia bacterium]|nr:Thioredoxin [Thermoleophilia bacterium]MCZ4495516.1 Thioredoxin [Thermoleophilia bacterium]
MAHVVAFFHSTTCGHSRRMDSIVDHFLRTHRETVKVAKVEVAERADLATRFNITSAPTLILLEDMVEVARLEGRATLPDIKDAFEPFLGLEAAAEQPIELAGAC